MRILLRKINGVLAALIGSSAGAVAGGAAPMATGPAFAGFARLLVPLLAVMLLIVAVLQLLFLPASPEMVGAASAIDPTLLVGAALVGNTVDIYSTQTLMGVVANLKRKINGFAARFFGTVVTSETETVTFDIDEGKRYVAPYVHPDVPARVRGNKGRRVASFSPAYLKEKEALRPNAALKRAAGESFATPMDPQQRAAAMAGSIVEDQVGRIDRRVEQMAVESIVTGKIVVAGDGYDTQTVDFGRDESLDEADNTLTGSDLWTHADSDPLANVRAWNRKMLKISGSVITDVILDADAADAFLSNPKIQERLDKLNVNIGAVELLQAQEEGLQLLGQLEGVRYWMYAGWYTNDAGTELELFAGGRAVCVGQVDGIQNYGAIQDHDSMVAAPIYTKSWLQDDPSVRWIMSQSAPLPVPRRINATLVAKVA